MVAEIAISIALLTCRFFNSKSDGMAIFEEIAVVSKLHLKPGMKEPSEARKRTLALQDRAIAFSTNVNRSYPTRMSYPSEVVWNQLIRAADGTSNNLIEADNGSSDADFLHKMRIALREAKESKTCLAKIRLAPLAHADKVLELGLEQEADELAAIYSSIITNMMSRLSKQKRRR